ncbi:hypothetical protein SKDZ_11G1820 [Saccharomyces kudriavzevii ZP591]|nr:hypothetical protein SKDZ_11G1820 [Saccharomyces kudriavzevii ZP591]
MKPRFGFIVRFYSSKRLTFHSIAPPKVNASTVHTTSSPSKGKHRGKSLILVGTLALVTSVISVNYQKNKPVEFLE